MEKAAHELRYVSSLEPLPTIEVDVDTLDPDGPTVADIVREALAKHAAAHPALCATAYMYFTSKRKLWRDDILGICNRGRSARGV